MEAHSNRFIIKRRRDKELRKYPYFFPQSKGKRGKTNIQKSNKMIQNLIDKDDRAIRPYDC